ncbi:MAG TPA: hypothetical protein ENN07_08645 [candidate division Zixibacteria bacterium]|nr:hypothetical protein [candidate division Zixibacteria bacterium]
MKITPEYRESALHRALELVDEGIIILDGDGKIVFANYAGRSIESIAIDEHAERFVLREYIEKILPANEKNRIFRENIFAVRKCGAVFPANLEVHRCSNGEHCTVIRVRDLSDAEEVRRLTADVAEAEEAVRVEISRFLHDEIAQLLAISANKLAESQRSASLSDVNKTIADAASYLDEAIKKIQRRTWELGSSIALDSGLSEALQDLLYEIVAREGIDTDFIDDGEDKPLNEHVKLALFQMARELFYNIIKHAQATQVNVVLEKEARFIRIIVEDNGKGFAHNNKMPSSGGGFGLATIERRLNSFDGEMKIKTERGKGTRVELYAPLHNGGANDHQSAYRR